MTRQPTPSLAASDVERIVRRDFPADRTAEVLTLLREYDTGDGSGGSDRVRIAALELAAGSVERLRSGIERARLDPRDVIAAAEYPGYLERGSRIGELSSDERQRIIDADWSQYRDWLRRC